MGDTSPSFKVMPSKASQAPDILEPRKLQQLMLMLIAMKVVTMMIDAHVDCHDIGDDDD